MSGSSNTPDIETLQQARQEFAQGNISESELEQVQSGQASLDDGAANESVVESAGAPGLREMGIDPEDGL